MPLLVPSQTTAQEANFANVLRLQSDQMRYKLLPHIYISKSADQNLNSESYKKFIAQHLAGDRGEVVPGSVLNMGAAAKPHWLIFAVENQSWETKWVLSFGKYLDGRVGLVDEIFIYDNSSKKSYINTLSAQKNEYIKKEKLSGTSISLDIPKGKKTLIFAYIVPKAGMPSTVVPELISEELYAKKRTAIFSKEKLLTYYFMIMAGFFLATILLRQMWSNGLFSVYYIVLLIMLLHQNEIMQLSSLFAVHMPGIFFNLSVIIGLLITKKCLDVGKLQRFQSRLVSLFVIGLTVSTILASVLIPDSSGLQLTIMYLPALLAILFLCLLSLARGYTEHPEGYQFAFGWFIVFIGASISVVSLMNIFVAPVLLINSYWFALVIQGGLFVTAILSQIIQEERTGIIIEQERQDEQKSVENITASREASENARLLRMIEHERQVMTELREREAQQNEEMRKAKEEADLANNAKSAFLAVISHEIRTPMTGIMGMVRFLLETNLNQQQKGYAQTLQDSCDAMLALLNDILDFEKIESGKMDLEQIDFDLHRLIQGVKTLMSGHAEAKNIDLKVNLDPDIPRYVIGDPVRLRQVILNLTGNSIKFTEEGGVTIHIKMDYKGIGDSASGNRIRFSVEDTGVGISKEAQKSLFNPFSQADSSVSRKFGGTGLGLAISQKLIEAMGGQIEIDSTEGHGSTFFFSVLMEEGSAEAVESAEASGGQSVQRPEKVMRILIVEDNEINQKLMKELVDRMGHDTSVADSGEQALEIIEDKDFDLVLMDIQLPGMTGMGTTKAIRALGNREKASMPVIAMTGNVKEEDIRQCYASNMNGHLAKPIDPKKLKDQIEKVIDNKLDNPVEVTEDKRDEHTQITQLGTGKEKFGVDEQSAQESKAADQDVEKAQTQEKPLMNEADDPKTDNAELEEMPNQNDEADKEFSEDADSEFSDLKDDIAPIMAALGDSSGNGSAASMSLDFSEEELDEDSFEQALEIAESQKDSGNETFDRAMLEALRGSVGDDQFNSLLSEMLVKAEEILMAIEKASNENDLEALRARAHELKGMAGNFGFTEISGIAAKIEDAAKDNETQGINELVPALPVAHDKAKHAIDTWMEGS